jgi:hypothetical protein
MGEAETPWNAEGRSQSGMPEARPNRANPWSIGIVTAGSPDETAIAIAFKELRGGAL